jgi:hypothetical protein
VTLVFSGAPYRLVSKDYAEHCAFPVDFWAGVLWLLLPGALEKGEEGRCTQGGTIMTVTDCRMYEVRYPEVDDVVMVSVCVSSAAVLGFCFNSC